MLAVMLWHFGLFGLVFKMLPLFVDATLGVRITAATTAARRWVRALRKHVFFANIWILSSFVTNTKKCVHFTLSVKHTTATLSMQLSFFYLPLSLSLLLFYKLASSMANIKIK